MRFKKILIASLCSAILGCGETATESEADELSIIFAGTAKRPLEFSGSLDIIDAAVDDTGPLWAIGILSIKGSSTEALVEFSEDVLKDAGITSEFDYPKSITLWLNDPKNEYYQVVKIR